MPPERVSGLIGWTWTICVAIAAASDVLPILVRPPSVTEFVLAYGLVAAAVAGHRRLARRLAEVWSRVLGPMWRLLPTIMEAMLVVCLAGTAGVQFATLTSLILSGGR